ncbi:MAG: chorismate mutase [Clostridiales bacterium]|jgi:chorismate mutase|nr:chorismate mutase [Eubacteriales bacterium]MDH7565353.1 chorismate mutase [Clostridiales bacterium]
MGVRAIRGAVTVENNSASDIIGETKALLTKMAEKNRLVEEDIISIIFTMTEDLNAAFPAIAARQLGWNSAALMCMREIDVPGSLNKCIRVMMHINTDKTSKEINHVYLKDARVLRPDLADKQET